MTPLDQVNFSELPRKTTRLEQTRLLLQEALTSFKSGRVSLSFSGAEDVVLIDLVKALGLKVDVFSLDTGRLHEEIPLPGTPIGEASRKKEWLKLPRGQEQP